MPLGNSRPLWSRPAEIEKTPPADRSAVITSTPDSGFQDERRRRMTTSRMPVASECSNKQSAAPLALVSDLEALRREDGLVGSRLTKVVVSPPVGFRAERQDGSTRYYYINGIVSDRQSLCEQLATVAKVRGNKVTALINSEEAGVEGVHGSGIISAVGKALAGMASSTLGTAAEERVVKLAMAEIKQCILRDGTQARFDVHSHGSIILSNALRSLQKEVKATEWEKICKLISVTTFGAPMHLFPKGIHVQEFVHTDDPVPTLGKVAAEMRQEVVGALHQIIPPGTLGAYKLPAILQPAKTVEIKCTKGDEHCAAGYLRDVPRFFVEQYRHEGKLDFVGLARGIIVAQQKGDFSELTLKQISAYALEHDNKNQLKREIEKIKSGGKGMYRA